jgi:predicted metal-dependent peptidase
LKCKICEREAVNEYCELHEKAHEKVVQRYELWKKAMDISWKEYLNEIAENPYTGSCAKEVARHLAEKGRDKT